MNFFKNVIKRAKHIPKESGIGFQTKCIHAGQDVCPTTGAVIQPIIYSSTFAQVTPGQNYPADCMYTRIRNPTRTALEKNLAALENAKHGFVSASGLGSISVIAGLFESGDHILCPNDVYGGTYELFNGILAKKGLEFTFTDDFTDMEALEEHFQDNTKAVWFESPTNPTLQCYDIEAIAEIAKKRDCLVVVDNTFMSPVLQNPLEMGADIVFHSCTKYLNGHADVVLGVSMTNDDGLAEKLFFLNKTTGASASPMDCFMVLRGTKTLGIRVERAQENAMAVAAMLEAHPKISLVLYPGLKSHPQHEISKKNSRGPGAMITFYVDGDLEQCRDFLENLKLFTLAVSLGGVESLVESPALMTHAGIPEEERLACGITNNLIRISVGIEDAEDLLWDLDQALSFV